MSNGQQNKFEAVSVLRDRLTRLHAERGAFVVEAKDARIAHGVQSGGFKGAWNVVEKLTGQIEQAQRELDAATRAAAVCVMPTMVVCELVGALDEIRCYPAWKSGEPLPGKAANYDSMRARADNAVKAFERSEYPSKNVPVQESVGTFVPGAQDVAQIVDALDNISGMAAYDPAIGLTVEQVGRAYEEMREIARLAVACWERAQKLAEGEVPA
jgi:hypothetical protein